MPAQEPGIVVGMDIGGTKIHLRATRGGQLVTDRVFPSENWTTEDRGAAVTRLVEFVEMIPRGEGGIAAVAVGAHGCDSASTCAELRTGLISTLGVPCAVFNDAELLVPAAGLTTGIGLVAGTGSVAVGRDSDGTPVYVGGWGWLLGDEGGAAGLVREAVKASLTARDRGEPPDLLAELLLRSFGAAQVADLPDHMITQGGARAWGERAALVFEALSGGSGLAATVVRGAAAALARLVAGVHARVPETNDVVVAGSVILNQQSLFTAFERQLAALLPACRVRRLTTPPVHGAIRLAERLGAGR